MVDRLCVQSMNEDSALPYRFEATVMLEFMSAKAGGSR